ncbi:hypothetical protein ACP70R_028267 [Stipagrostis hirtigluma subsp. patula]
MRLLRRWLLLPCVGGAPTARTARRRPNLHRQSRDRSALTTLCARVCGTGEDGKTVRRRHGGQFCAGKADGGRRRVPALSAQVGSAPMARTARRWPVLRGRGRDRTTLIRCLVRRSAAHPRLGCLLVED